jgi:hypothetical protein
MFKFEWSSLFCQAGQAIYPDIELIIEEFDLIKFHVFHLNSLSDIIEQVEDDHIFLDEVRRSCCYTLLEIPIEECLTNQKRDGE